LLIASIALFSAILRRSFAMSRPVIASFESFAISIAVPNAASASA
jgi:hypothetical protein